jgi:hypothetical protein
MGKRSPAYQSHYWRTQARLWVADAVCGPEP